MVENGAAAPKPCLSSLEMRTTSAAGGLLPTGKTSTAIKPPSTSHLFGSTRPRRQIQRRLIYGLKFHPRCTKTVSGDINCLLPPPAGGSSRQNQGKIGCLIQAVIKVVPAPARFWERGARCFVVRLCVLEQLVTICSVFGGSMIQASKLAGEGDEPFTHTYCGQSFFLRYSAFKNTHAVEGGSRL